jgi:hypothetical protein
MKDRGLEEVHEAIVRGHRAGVCDSEGRTDFVNTINGRYPRATSILKSSGCVGTTYVVRHGKCVEK